MKKFLLLLAGLVALSSAQSQIVQEDLMVIPIVDGVYPYNWVQDFRVVYKDPGRCTDFSFIELITDSGHVKLKPVSYNVSCEIVSYGRATDAQLEHLRRNPLRFVRIENPQSDNVYYFKVKQPDGLQKILKEYR